jgi:CRISPR-associated protein Cmr6
MNTPNIGWLYFKDYLRENNSPSQLFNRVRNLNKERSEEIFKEHFAEKNQAILEQEFSANTSAALVSELAKSIISLKTVYPGLTLGTGYTHEINETGEFKLGFFFDHATGYPCIPGSTVKGCLRGMFPQKEHEEMANKDEKYNYLASVIRELPGLDKEIIAKNELGEEYDQKEHLKREAFIDRLEMEIFEGKKPVIKQDGTIENQPNCIYERDIFFDAYLVSTQHPAINRSSYQNSKPFIGEDYITPHVNRKNPAMSPFTNPVPLMFLKILPEVSIQFQFDLKSREDGLISKEQKEELFRRLLIDFGIGAKTNVGYGQFDEGEKQAILSSNTSTGIKINVVLEEKHPSTKAIPYLKQGKTFPGEMVGQSGKYSLYRFYAGNEECILKKDSERNPGLKIGDTVTVRFNRDYTKENPNFKIV